MNSESWRTRKSLYGPKARDSSGDILVTAHHKEIVMLRQTLAALVLTASVPAIGLGQLDMNPAYVAPESRNAAVQYWVAFSFIPSEAKTLSDLNWERIGSEFDPEKIPADLKSAMELDLELPRAELLQATRMNRCNFECRWEDGLGMTLPHLGKLRLAARALRMDARRAAMRGDAARAVEDLLAIRRMARHLASEPIAISKLVTIAIDSLALDEAIALAGSGKLSAAQRDELLSDIAATPLDDIFKASELFLGERTLLAAQFSPHGPGLRERVKSMRDLVSPEIYGKLIAMSDAELQSQVRMVEAVLGELQAAWKKAEPTGAISQIQEDIAAGKHGVLSQAFTPSFSNMRASCDKAIARVRNATDALRAASLER